MRLKKPEAFTLVEVLLVVVILGLLAAVAIPRLAHSGTDAKRSMCKANVALLNSQIELWALNHDGRYPVDHKELMDQVIGNKDFFPDGPPECPHGHTYLYDPSTGRVLPHRHAE